MEIVFPQIFRQFPLGLARDLRLFKQLCIGFGYGDLGGRFRSLVEKFPGLSGESEQRDLPSANFDKPVKEVPLYLIADAHALCIKGEN